MYLVFYVLAIKINADGFCAIQAHYNLKHHVNVQFNKIHTTSYVNATRDGGMISQGIGREIIQTIDPMVCRYCGGQAR